MDIRVEKREIRKKILSLRDKLSENDLNLYSSVIMESFFSLDEVKSGKTFFIFVNFKSEVKTTPIIEKLIKDGKRVVVPYTDAKNKQLILCYIKSLSELKEGTYGILEPDISISERANLADIDIAVIPGSVFDVSGGRVGYGGGFYDRVIPKLRADVPKIALAFDFQVIEKVPMGYYDKRMDIIVTEKRIIRIGK
ncbi:MAG: 5-formyltetrahydrofolate cyclo-ligase [Proteobacteria bacterium]|nr:5-formyltetrahydrofolate cyclo-ligase [Pseudomonadota bacterium]